MTYTFKNTLAKSEVQVTEKQTRWMVERCFGSKHAPDWIAKLDSGRINSIPVHNGRITKGHETSTMP